MNVLDVVVAAANTPVFNSTAQIYQIILQFLIFVINLFSMFALFYLVLSGDALDRARERKESRKALRDTHRNRDGSRQ